MNANIHRSWTRVAAFSFKTAADILKKKQCVDSKRWLLSWKGEEKGSLSVIEHKFDIYDEMQFVLRLALTRKAAFTKKNLF